MRGTRGARRRIAALLIAPFVASIVLPRLLAPRVGDALGRGLAALGRAVAAPAPSDKREAGPPGEARPPVPAAVPSPDGQDLATEPRDGGAPRAGTAGARRSRIAIDGPTTARLLAGAVSTAGGRTARDADGRAIGVRLRGVSQLGVGLRDGDIVTSIDGQPTPTDDDATPIAIAALGRGKPVRATIVRDGHPIDVYVELPSAADPTAPR